MNQPDELTIFNPNDQYKPKPTKTKTQKSLVYLSALQTNRRYSSQGGQKEPKLTAQLRFPAQPNKLANGANSSNYNQNLKRESR